MPVHPTDVPLEVTWQLPRSPRSAGRARALLREQLAAWKIDGTVAETAELFVSELVTNSVQHAYVPPGREIGVRFARYDGVLRIEVADANGCHPTPHQAGDDDERGRGLAIIVALAQRWGYCPRRHGIGKAVWAELKLPEQTEPLGSVTRA
ncbi:ATP-binding protein [Streptomyces sp. ISL-96]|uniref:ATP-binding protein n=1 Tax=Streptomyces sp. ISL-96 TaxID=2819191 RepID=UPI001BEC4499|nr:ATP-binding protein [Streptomyces sp. ISL-96]MBT2488171.1 ATP-binding protein [Streptomyces sp. ISL-96]